MWIRWLATDFSDSSWSEPKLNSCWISCVPSGVAKECQQGRRTWKERWQCGCAVSFLAVPDAVLSRQPISSASAPAPHWSHVWEPVLYDWFQGYLCCYFHHSFQLIILNDEYHLGKFETMSVSASLSTTLVTFSLFTDLSWSKSSRFNWNPCNWEFCMRSKESKLKFCKCDCTLKLIVCILICMCFANNCNYFQYNL